MGLAQWNPFLLIVGEALGQALNITGKKVVNDYKTQLNDALVAYYVGLNA